MYSIKTKHITLHDAKVNLSESQLLQQHIMDNHRAMSGSSLIYEIQNLLLVSNTSVIFQLEIIFLNCFWK